MKNFFLLLTFFFQPLIFATKRIKTTVNLAKKVVTFYQKNNIKNVALDETFNNYQKGIPVSRAISFFQQMAKIESCYLCRNIDKKFHMQKLEQSNQYAHQKCLNILQSNNHPNELN